MASSDLRACGHPLGPSAWCERCAEDELWETSKAAHPSTPENSTDAAKLRTLDSVALMARIKTLAHEMGRQDVDAALAQKAPSRESFDHAKKTSCKFDAAIEALAQHAYAEGRADEQEELTATPENSNPLRELAQACMDYDAAIRSCADDPKRMDSFCTATGDDLNDLYEGWLHRALAALSGSGHPVDSPKEKT